MPLGVLLILMPTFVGRLRVIRGLLRAEIFSVISRLVFMVYMIHSLVIFWFLVDTRQPFHINNLDLWFVCFGGLIASLFFAIPFTLICEVPFMNIEKYILFPPKIDPGAPLDTFTINGAARSSEYGLRFDPSYDTTEYNLIRRSTSSKKAKE